MTEAEIAQMIATNRQTFVGWLQTSIGITLATFFLAYVIRNTPVYVRAALFAVFFKMGWHEQLTFEKLKARQGELQASVAANKTVWIFGFAVAYIVMAAAQLPGAALMTLAGGVLFLAGPRRPGDVPEPSRRGVVDPRGL